MITRRNLSRCAAAAILSVANLAPGGSPVIAQDLGASDKDVRVANFVAAERMDGGHPAVTLSFWSGPHGKVIDYDPGRGSRPVRLQPVGRAVEGQGLRVRAPDGAIWTLMPSEGVLLLDNGGPRPRVLLWQYQGPVYGGTPRVPSASRKKMHCSSSQTSSCGQHLEHQTERKAHEALPLCPIGSSRRPAGVVRCPYSCPGAIAPVRSACLPVGRLAGSRTPAVAGRIRRAPATGRAAERRRMER